MPEVLSHLTQLTSLTLNQNESLGGEGSASAHAALATLSSLKRLEMRECGLTAVPSRCDTPGGGSIWLDWGPGVRVQQQEKREPQVRFQ